MARAWTGFNRLGPPSPAKRVSWQGRRRLALTADGTTEVVEDGAVQAADHTCDWVDVTAGDDTDDDPDA